MKCIKQQYTDENTSRQVRGHQTARKYPYLRSYSFKIISTYQEKSKFALHRLEYRSYGLQLRASRGKQLVTTWDHLPSHLLRHAKSWKHVSKRRHQYYKQRPSDCSFIV